MMRRQEYCKLANFISLKPDYNCWLIMLAIVFISCRPAHADYQSLESIYQAVNDFVKTQYAETEHLLVSGRLDDRLRVANCTETLDIRWAKGHRDSGNTTLEIRCNHMATLIWKTYLPVTIQVFKSIAVSRRNIRRGEILRASDVAIEKRDISNLQENYIERIEPFIGYIATQAIAPHQSITTQALQPPHLIKRGENITLIAKSSAFEVRISGEALADGKLGDTIRIRNHASHKIVEGRVIAKGLAQAQY